MINPEIVLYIKTEKAKKTADSVIKANLLANGWTEHDVNEAISAITSNISIATQTITTGELKAYRSRTKWITFVVLLVMDFILIMIMGGYGLFGVSPVSIIVRIIVIYIISYFSTSTAKPEVKTWKTVVSSVGRIVGSIFIAIVVIIGLFFAYCLFYPPHF